MAEDFWWKKAGIFYWFAGRSQFPKRIHETVLRRVDELNLPKEAAALEAGCGDGNVTFPLSKRGFDITAIDFGDSLLKRAEKKRLRQGISNIHFEFGDLNSPLKYPDKRFDLVTCCHVMMKIKNYKLALSEFHRVLKPGGYAVVSTTSSDETFTSWFLRYIKERGPIKAFWDARWLIAWGIPYVLLTKKSERRDEWRWSTEELSRHMEDAGFKTLSVEDIPYTHVGCALGVYRKQP